MTSRQTWRLNATVMRGVLVGLVGTLFGGSCARLSEEKQTHPPHVVLIVLDTMRADGLGATFEGTSLTPALDRIAAEGRLFARAYSSAPWTVPSHASIFTGLYPHKHRAVHGRFQLDVSVTTMAEILKERGYATGGFTCNPWLHAKSGMAQGFDIYIEAYRDNPTGDKGATNATKQVVDWLEKTATGGKPVFLFVNYLEAHLPYAPSERFLEKVGLADADSAQRRFTIKQAEAFILGQRTMSAQDWQHARALYAAEIAYLDEQVAHVRQCLERLAMWDNTLLIITSDHGEHFGENGLTGHEFSVSDAVLHVPLIVRYPKQVAPGSAVRAPVGLVDVLPTVLDILGQQNAAKDLPGQSLLKAIRHENQSHEDQADDRVLLAEYSRPVKLVHEYWQNRYPEADLSRFDVSFKTIRHGQYKYVVNGRGQEKLYDLAADPGETRDVSEAQAERMAAMQQMLNDQLSGGGRGQAGGVAR